MSMSVDEYVNAYRLLCSQLMIASDDFDEKNVQRHNRAMQRLIALQESMKEDGINTVEIYARLLNDEDIGVRQNAAIDCLLDLHIHTKQSLKILRWIGRHGDVAQKADVKRALLIWKGKLRPDEPF